MKSELKQRELIGLNKKGVTFEVGDKGMVHTEPEYFRFRFRLLDALLHDIGSSVSFISMISPIIGRWTEIPLKSIAIK